MKVGDLVKDNRPFCSERVGVIISEDHDCYGGGFVLNKAFKVLWRSGTIGNNVWDYDLKIIKSS